MPRVTTMTACFCERPVAKAFGTRVSAKAIRGFGVFDRAQRRSIIPVQLRRLLRGDVVGAERHQRDLVGEEPLARGEGQRDHDRDHDVAGQGDHHAHEHDVDQAEHEHHQNHAPGQPVVGAEAGLHRESPL